MQKQNAVKKFRLTPKKIILPVIALLAAAWVGWQQINAYINRPQDIGPGLEYVGKSDYTTTTSTGKS